MKYMMFPTDIEVEARGEKGYLETVKLFKIRALKDFSDVKAGDFGGYIQDESNLSQEGDCWIYNYAKVYDGAKIEGNAQIRNEATVSTESIVDGEAQVLNSAVIEKDSKVTGSAKISDNVKVTEGSIISGNTDVSGSVYIGNSTIKDNACISKDSRISISTVSGNSVICNSRILQSNIDGDTIINESDCKMLATKGKTYIMEANINVNSVSIGNLFTVENANIIHSNIRESIIKDSDICRSIVCYSKGIIKTTLQNSTINYGFIKLGYIKKDSDYLYYDQFGSSKLNITFYRGKGGTISASVNEDSMLIERFLAYIKSKYSQRVLTEVEQLLNAICIEGKCSEKNTLIYSIAHR